MKPYNKMYGIIYLIVIVFAFFLVSCESAKETAENIKDNSEEVVDETTKELEDLTDETVENMSENLNEVMNNDNFIGTWSGKFDIRTATMVITKQEGNDFEGKVTINLRTVINQDVKGSFDPNTNSVIIKDQLRSKFKGVYTGELSDDGNNFSGNFKTNLDNRNYEFSFTKK